MILRHLHWLFGALLVSGTVFGATPAGSEILLQSARVTITRADFEAAVERVIPEDRRVQFMMNPQRLTTFVNDLLVRKTLAAMAREQGLDREPLPPGTTDAEGVLARRASQKMEQAAAADFDARIDRFAARAKEIYLVDTVKYVTPEEVDVSHVLIAAKAGEQDAALARAAVVRDRLAKGADFATTAREVSDDPTAAANGGHLGWLSREKLDTGFADAAFGLAKVGELSMPVRSKYGYHVIRLDGRRPSRQLGFDEAREIILARLRADYVGAQRDLQVDAIRSDPALKVNQPALEALVITIDPEFIRRAQRTTAPTK